MTHLVLDSALLDALVATGDDVAHAADNRLCTCEYNVPYDSGQVERVLVTKCFRCRALALWADARAKVQTAKGGQVEADALTPSPTAESAPVGSAGPLMPPQ